jgi:hypothetical protein
MNGSRPVIALSCKVYFFTFFLSTLLPITPRPRRQPRRRLSRPSACPCSSQRR